MTLPPPVCAARCAVEGKEEVHTLLFALYTMSMVSGRDEAIDGVAHPSLGPCRAAAEAGRERNGR